MFLGFYKNDEQYIEALKQNYDIGLKGFYWKAIKK